MPEVAHTIADPAGCKNVETEFVADEESMMGTSNTNPRF
jgi:hypothetical protein